MNIYNVAVIDIGSPKQGNIGWCFIDSVLDAEHHGRDLEALFPLIGNRSDRALLLGLEAPLCVPLRPDLMLALKARKGEGQRPWSAGAGAQVLAMNLPIMSYIFRKIKEVTLNASFVLNPSDFKGDTGQIMPFEALVSGADKGDSHVEDAQIMARYCLGYAKNGHLPPSILEEEEDVTYLNLAAAALLRYGFISEARALSLSSPIFKPSHNAA